MKTTESKKKLINLLTQSNIITFDNDYKNNSGQPYHINLRLLNFYPKAMKLTAQFFGESLKDYTFGLLAGPFTDILLATTISLEFDWPMIFVRQERKEHGTERLVEGNFQPGERVAVIDDEVDDIAGTLQLMGRLEGSGLEIVGLFTLLDREFGAVKAVEEKGYKCFPLLTLNDIFLEMVQSGTLRQQQLEVLKKFTEERRREFLSKNNLTTS